MFDLLRFTWYYRRLKRAKRVDGEWSFSLEDAVTLLNRLPTKCLNQLNNTDIHHIGRYRGGFYHPTPHDLLVSVSQLVRDMRTLSETHPDYTTSVEYPLNVWLQPTAKPFLFNRYTLALTLACNELQRAYLNLPDNKRGYYRRRSQPTVTDIFSYAEIVSELVLARRTLDDKT